MAGRQPNGAQKYRCKHCGKHQQASYKYAACKPGTDQRVIAHVKEGCGIWNTARLAAWFWAEGAAGQGPRLQMKAAAGPFDFGSGQAPGPAKGWVPQARNPRSTRWRPTQVE
jgi:hypothetical protein